MQCFLCQAVLVKLTKVNFVSWWIYFLKFITILFIILWTQKWLITADLIFNNLDPVTFPMARTWWVEVQVRWYRASKILCSCLPYDVDSEIYVSSYLIRIYNDIALPLGPCISSPCGFSLLPKVYAPHTVEQKKNPAIPGKMNTGLPVQATKVARLY